MKVVNTEDWLFNIAGQPRDFSIVEYEDSDGKSWYAIQNCGADYADDICGSDNLDSVKTAIVAYEEVLEDTKGMRDLEARDKILEKLENTINEYAELTC